MAAIGPAPCALYILTCPGREAALAHTLDSVAASDWPAPPGGGARFRRTG